MSGKREILSAFALHKNPAFEIHLKLTPDTFVKPSIVTLRIEAEIPRSKGDVIVGNSSIVADDDKIIFLVVSQ